MADKLYAITPSTGVPLTQTQAEPMVQPGSKVVGKDGRDYIYVHNSGAEIDAATAVIVTEPAMTVAAGAGDWVTTDVVPAGSYAWVRRDTL